MYQAFLEIENPPLPAKKKYDNFIKNTIIIGGYLLLLIIGLLEARLMCYYDLPSDCRKTINNWNIYENTTNILEKGMVLILISNLTINIKKIVRKLSLLLYIILFLITGPLFALAGEFPGMQTSLATFTVGFNISFIVYLSCLILITVLLSYELYIILRYHGKLYLVCYGFSRFLIILYYFIFSLLLSKEYNIHIHHLYIGYIIACLAHDNKFISWISLSIGSGIMVQGIGSYNFATIIQD